MKKIFTLISILLAFNSEIWAQATPNASFEAWTTQGFPSYSDPDNWESANSQTAITGTFSCAKATSASDIHSGSAAVKLMTKQIGSPFNQTVPGVVTTGTLPTSMGGTISGGIPYTLKPDSIVGWYKYTSVGGDNGFAEFMLFGSAANNTDTVAKARFATPTSSVSTYTRFSAPLVYNSTNAVANSMWLLSSSNEASSAQIGSYIFFDDLELIFNPVVPVSLTVPNQTNATCDGYCNGSATAAAAAGTSPYSYQWSNSQTGATATGLCAGSYSVTVTDAASQTASATVTITQPSALSGTISQTNVSCNGGANGTATVSAAGGTAPYTYLWSNSQTSATSTGLTAGMYSVTVTDSKGCTKNSSATITQPGAIAITVSSTNASCGNNNGSVSASASGGTGPLSYLWSSGATTQTITGLLAGAYTITVTDNNSCTGISTANVSNTGAPATTISNQVNVSCNGGNNGSATVSATGGATPYTYAWSTTPQQTTQTATGLAAGNYSVSVTDTSGVCPGIVSLIITEPSVLTTPTISTPDSGNSSGTATVLSQGGTSPYIYAWSPGGQTTATITGLNPGNYSVTVTDANGCTSTGSVVVSTYIGISSQQSLINSQFSIYPNPAEKIFFVNANEAKTGSYEINVLNVTGQVLFTETFYHPGGKLNKEVIPHEIKEGLLFIQLISEKGVFVFPMIKVE